MFTAGVTKSGWEEFPIMSGSRNAGGFTYIGALILVVVASIALMEAGRYWSTVMQREKEEELLFRGDQIRRAIQSYCSAGKGGPIQYPGRLEDLAKDPRSLSTRRHLRRLYKDPFSPAGEWGTIRTKGGGIKGVFSRSDAKPMKTGNVPEPYQEFEAAVKYSDWKFIFSGEANTEPAKSGS